MAVGGGPKCVPEIIPAPSPPRSLPPPTQPHSEYPPSSPPPAPEAASPPSNPLIRPPNSSPCTPPHSSPMPPPLPLAPTSPTPSHPPRAPPSPPSTPPRPPSFPPTPSAPLPLAHRLAPPTPPELSMLVNSQNAAQALMGNGTISAQINGISALEEENGSAAVGMTAGVAAVVGIGLLVFSMLRKKKTTNWEAAISRMALAVRRRVCCLPTNEPFKAEAAIAPVSDIPARGSCGGDNDSGDGDTDADVDADSEGAKPVRTSEGGSECSSEGGSEGRDDEGGTALEAELDEPLNSIPTPKGDDDDDGDESGTPIHSIRKTADHDHSRWASRGRSGRVRVAIDELDDPVLLSSAVGGGGFRVQDEKEQLGSASRANTKFGSSPTRTAPSLLDGSVELETTPGFPSLVPRLQLDSASRDTPRLSTRLADDRVSWGGPQLSSSDGAGLDEAMGGFAQIRSPDELPSRDALSLRRGGKPLGGELDPLHGCGLTSPRLALCEAVDLGLESSELTRSSNLMLPSLERTFERTFERTLERTLAPASSGDIHSTSSHTSSHAVSHADWTAAPTRILTPLASILGVHAALRDSGGASAERPEASAPSTPATPPSVEPNGTTLTSEQSRAETAGVAALRRSKQAKLKRRRDLRTAYRAEVLGAEPWVPTSDRWADPVWPACNATLFGADTAALSDGQAMSPPARPSTVAAAVHRRSNRKAVVPLRTSPLIDDHLASYSTPGPSPEDAWREAMRQERINRDHCYCSDAGPSSNVPSDSPEERWRNRIPSDSPEERWRRGMQEEKQARLIAAEWQRTSAFSRG